MGAQTFAQTGIGYDVNDVFNELVEEARWTHGNDSYNGTISTTSLAGRIDIDPKIIKKGNDAISKFIDENDSLCYPRKWDTQYADLGVKHYEALTPKWVADKQEVSRKKGVRTLTKYILSNSGYNRHTYETLTDAKREAKRMSLQTEKSITVSQLRSDGQSFRLGRMELLSDGKQYKSARKAKTKVYLPVNEFLFFVYASE